MRRRSGMTAISLVISLAIILVLMWIFFSYGTRGMGGKSALGPPEQALQRARDVQCRENLRSIRQALQLATMSEPNERFPPDLSNLGIGADQLKCPVSGQPYAYEPSTGKVWCTYPPHKGY